MGRFISWMREVGWYYVSEMIVSALSGRFVKYPEQVTLLMFITTETSPFNWLGQALSDRRCSAVFSVRVWVSRDGVRFSG